MQPLTAWKRVLPVAVLLAAAALGSEEPAKEVPVVLGLDHIPVAVNDLEAAAERYRQLGFALKPGRPHDNGIRNQHVKFPDGTELELITADEARDSLTTYYRRHLAAGDGPAFLALYAPETDRLAGKLHTLQRTYRRNGGMLTFPEPDPLRYLFFARRNHSPTDRPEHFRHANGGDALIGVWLAGEDLGTERRLFAALGAAFAEKTVHVPETVQATVARLQEGEIVFLPGSRQAVPGRRIVGATVRTRDLEAVRRVLEKARQPVPRVVRTPEGSSLFLPPSLTHGIWLEFREP